MSVNIGTVSREDPKSQGNDIALGIQPSKLAVGSAWEMNNARIAALEALLKEYESFSPDGMNVWEFKQKDNDADTEPEPVTPVLAKPPVVPPPRVLRPVSPSNSSSMIIQTGNQAAKAPLTKGVLARGQRACCRIRFANGVSPKELARQYNRKPEYIKRIIENDVSQPDDVEQDYCYADAETKEKYPPVSLPPNMLKRRGSGLAADRAAKRSAASSVLTTSEGTQGPASNLKPVSDSLDNINTSAASGSKTGEPKVPLTAGQLSRGQRALCRILFDYSATVQVLATQFHKTSDYITRVVENSCVVIDNLDEDYKHVDAQIMIKYPPRPGSRLSGPKDKAAGALDLSCTQGSRAPQPVSVSILDTAQIGPTSSASHNGNDDLTSNHDHPLPTLAEFLSSLSPPLSRILPTLTSQNFDDDMLHALLTQWTPAETEDTLKELVGAGTLTMLDMIVLRRGIGKWKNA